MNIKPLHDRVVIRQVEEEQASARNKKESTPNDAYGTQKPTHKSPI